jgi:hypothetical protein
VDKNDFKVLNEIYKGSHMGMDSIINMEETLLDSEAKNTLDEFVKIGEDNTSVKNIFVKEGSKNESVR